MAQTLSKLWVHVVFSTKNREPFLIDREVRLDLHRYMGMVAQEHHSPAVVGGVEDHVHILLLYNRNILLPTLVSLLKTSSSRWIKTKGRAYRDFHWQSGYANFSVSESNVQVVRQYIANQEQKHKKTTYQDEMRGFLKYHELTYDEQYVWD